jgi:tetratricopeptide (TPR) repeat protein
MYARFVAMVLFVSAPAAAQTADELIDQGLTMREQGRDEEALALFERAYELEPSAETSAQLGFVHQALGHWQEAHDRVSAALAINDAWVERHRATLERALAAIDEHLSTDASREPAAPPPPARSGSDPVGPGVLIGISAAVAVVAVILLAIGITDVTALGNTPPGTRLWTDVAADRDRAYALETAGAIGIGLGAIGIGAGVGWISSGGGETNVAFDVRARARW